MSASESKITILTKGPILTLSCLPPAEAIAHLLLKADSDSVSRALSIAGEDRVLRDMVLMHNLSTTSLTSLRSISDLGFVQKFVEEKVRRIPESDLRELISLGREDSKARRLSAVDIFARINDNKTIATDTIDWREFTR